MDSLCLTFVLPGDDEYELIPNGKEVEVSYANLQQYIDCVCYGYLLDSVKDQAEAFINGFSQFIGVENMKTFKSYEIEQVYCGSNAEEWTIEYLKQNVLAQHGYGSGSDSFNNLIQVMSLFTAEEKKDFLMFTIGAPRLPIGGLQGLSPKLTVVKKIASDMSDIPDIMLPSVMTCQNYIKLPDYSTYEILKKKLYFAMREGQNAFALS